MENFKVTLVVLNDGRMGHVNQSIALAKHLDAAYEIIPVAFTCKACKVLSYVLDFFKIYTHRLFTLKAPLPKHFDMLICAGSSTYYAAKTLSKTIGIKSIAMMLPQSYRYDFDLIFAQVHDNPPKRENIITLEANFSFVEPKGFFLPHSKSVGVIIGGNNAHFTMNKAHIKHQLDFIFAHFQGYEIAVTTSPRTPTEIESLLGEYTFAYRVIFSHNPINPIADFLEHCEVVFITMDSTSMISEAISYGKSCVEILPLGHEKTNKFFTMAHHLEKEHYAHIFDGTLGNHHRKIDFHSLAQKAVA
jgi:mitochondrial fission protein ELM1